MIIKKDSEIVKAKKERKSLTLKAKKKSSDEESLTSESEDENTSWQLETSRSSSREEVGSWSDSGEEDDENAKDETCLVAQASSEAYNGGNVIFGSNLRGNIIGKGTISHGSPKIANVEHADNLGFNLLSIGQTYDSKYKVIFFENDSEIVKDGKVIDKGHANMRLIQSLASKELVRNLPKLKFDQHFCDACKIRKQAHASHKAKNVVTTTRCLELLHMDLIGPSAIRSYGGTSTP
nr:retrovirus-related Pol polyprotein from transposon TNT 1-94 [Tanacetum cinerariifolium]